MKRSTENLVTHLSNAVERAGGDWSCRLEGGLEFAWSAEVRVTRFPNVRDVPDRSATFYQAGGGMAEDSLEPALRAAIAEVETWDLTVEGPPTWKSPA